MRTIAMIITLSTLLFTTSSYAGEWYENGTLHKSTVRIWQISQYENRLATTADFFVATIKNQSPDIYRSFKLLPIDEYLLQLKSISANIESCITKTGAPLSIQKQNEIQTAQLFSVCYIAWERGFRSSYSK